MNNSCVFEHHSIFGYSLPLYGVLFLSAKTPERRTLFRFFNPVGVNPLTEKNHLSLGLLPWPFMMPLQ